MIRKIFLLTVRITWACRHYLTLHLATKALNEWVWHFHWLHRSFMCMCLHSLFSGFYFLKGFHPHKNLLLFFDVHFIFCQIFLVLCILWRRNGDTRNYICYYCSTTDRKWIINYIDSLYKKLCIPISYLQERQEAWHGITKHMTNDEGVDITFSINID